MKNLIVSLVFVSLLLSPVLARDFKVDLPVRMQDIAQNAYGLWPFGVHGGGHGIDGHTGFDIEFRYGSYIYAAADGVVQSVIPGIQNPGTVTVQISHSVEGKDYRTIYSNIADLAPSIAAGIPVQAGQTLGKVGSQSLTLGQTAVTFQMTHFEVDDFSSNFGVTNPNAVSPELFLTDNGKAVLKEIWKTARYGEALCEPFITNPRSAATRSDPATKTDAANPNALLVRTWTLASGKGALKIRFTRTDMNSLNYQYAFLDAMDNVLESGTATVDSLKYDCQAVDFLPAPGQNPGVFGPRLGLFEARGETMRLDYSQPGMSRPNNLDKATIYTTTNP